MTQAVEHSAHLTALIANRFDLDSRGLEAKAECARLFPKRPIQNGIFDLGHPPAHPAYQELAAVLVFGTIATEERIQRVEAMHEPGFPQEVERAVDGGRSCFVAILRQLRQDLVSADGFVLPPHDFEHAPSQRGQVDLPRGANPFGRRDRALNASRVVMRRSLPVYCSRHTAISSSGHPVWPLHTFVGPALQRGIYCNSSAGDRKPHECNDITSGPWPQTYG